MRLPRTDAFPLRCAIYARKSTEDINIDQDRSVERQVTQSREFAESKGWRVLDEHVYVDDGVSGADFQTREGLLRMMDALKPRPPFDVVVMADSSRLGRDMLRTATAACALHDAGVRIAYYLTGEEERLDTTENRLMMILRGYGSEAPRQKAKQVTREALVSRAKRGLVAGGVVYGYRNVPVHDGIDSSGNPKRAYVRHEIEQTQAEVIRGIFRMFADGHGKRTIAKTLNGDPAFEALSVRYFGGQSVRPPRKGTGSWAPSCVDAMLKRDRYRGVIIYGKFQNTDKGGRTRCRTAQPRDRWTIVEIPNLRIVDEALWSAAQERRRIPRERTTAPVGVRVSKSLLSGLATCTLCDGPIIISGSQQRQRCYGCGRYRDRGPTVCANSMLEAIPRVDARLLEEIERTVLTPEARRYTLQRAAEHLQNQLRAKPTSSAPLLQKRLGVVRREIENLLRAVEQGRAPDAVLKRITEKEDEARQLAAAIEAIHRPSPKSVDLTRVDGLLADQLDRFGEVMRGDVVRARQALQRLLAERIRFTPLVLPDGQQTFQLEAKLSLGALLRSEDCSKGNVPDGI